MVCGSEIFREPSIVGIQHTNNCIQKTFVFQVASIATVGLPESRASIEQRLSRVPFHRVDKFGGYVEAFLFGDFLETGGAGDVHFG